MPRRDDISSICILGSGPIVIGQACEFDYSGSQAIRALRAEGYRIVLVNSNPATIMTDPEMADATYIEPLRSDSSRGSWSASAPTRSCRRWAGQTALNLAMDLHERGVLEELSIELLGAAPTSSSAPRTARPSARSSTSWAWSRPSAGSPGRSTRPGRSWSTPASRRSCAPASPWAAPAATSPTTAPSSRSTSAGRCPRARPPRCSSTRACWGGRSSSSR